MIIHRQFLINALLQHNFLPNQKPQRDELPPVISSRSFSESVAKKLVTCQDKPRKPSFGYDAVKYKLTRFNGVARVMSIPHPKAYAGLALSIADNWPRLSYIADSKTSKIIPRNHRDGRIIVMDYGNRLVKARMPLTLSFGRQFIVRTDISNCYPSIYSHSVPWATVGIDIAKQNAANSKRWYNKLDRALRLTKRNETNGIAIGPATSNIMSELILARVDSILRDKYGYVHTRYYRRLYRLLFYLRRGGTIHPSLGG